MEPINSETKNNRAGRQDESLEPLLLLFQKHCAFSHNLSDVSNDWKKCLATRIPLSTLTPCLFEKKGSSTKRLFPSLEIFMILVYRQTMETDPKAISFAVFV
ncbi:hypothetical protein CDAR_515601 [Caerostris darwini]|uniref:Uncharacterized protein n=1 Tax=Caerostris darwini TaxID=1538125 RepID=A0AAV4S5T2_9ARAC|nr:hypothetical protein CDAR_515601 [Caerostris darwini]